jgi:tetratricopeptide (TPR) repeat protein
VFAGSAGLAEIEQVCGIDLGMDPLTGISTLVDHSLLNQFERLGEPRYRMLLTIRDFAAERLAERGEHSDIADRHSATYLGWAEAAEPHLTADEPGIWLDRFTLEHDNLRAALHHSIDAGHADEAARLGYNVWRFWHMRGHLIEGRRALDLVLELPGSRPEARAKALEAAGGVAYWQGDMTAAGVHYEAALALQQQLGDETAIAYALYNLSFAYLFGHGPRKAVALLEDSLDRFERLSDERGIAVATWGLGNGYLELERRQDAHEAFRRSTAAFERLGEPFNLGWSLYSMGETDVSLGHHDEAREHFERGIRLFADANDLSAVVMFMAGFAAVAVLQGDGERAARLAGALAKLRERTGTDLVEVGSAAAHVVSTNRELDQLGADHLEAFAEGRRMTPATAVGYALGELDASGLPTRANS